MKRILTIALVLMLLPVATQFVVAESEEEVSEPPKEILFQGIPWETDANTVRIMLIDKGFPMDEIWSGNYAIGYFAPGAHSHSSRNGGCGVGIVADSNSLQVFPKTIAGYPIESCWTSFAYAYENEEMNTNIEDTHFIYAGMEFDTLNPQYVYDDLTRKLSSLYGEPESMIGKTVSTSYYWKTEEHGVNFCDYAVWYGANNTAVWLEYRYEIIEETSLRKDESLCLYYGKTDSEERVTALDRLIEKKKEEEKQRQLEIERQKELEQLQQNQNNDVSGL